MNEKKQWGGRRKGAGRSTHLVDAKRITIWLEAKQIEWLKAQGDQGETIRRLIDEARGPEFVNRNGAGK